jgi:hypothetical protein
MCPSTEDFLWGTIRFSAGLWVGGGVTPNSLHTIPYQKDGRLVQIPGAFDLLTGASQSMGTHSDFPGEPAQVLTCPACRWIHGGTVRQTVLAVPDEGFPRGYHRLHLVLQGVNPIPVLEGVS